MSEIKKCSICKKEFTGFGNNAEPLNNGRCCDECNLSFVLPERIRNHLKNKEEQVEAE